MQLGSLMSKLYKLMAVSHMTTMAVMPPPHSTDKMHELKVLSQDYNRAQK